ncbi:putative rho guanine nucleotide exchange factor 26 [Sesbania bispinosa]|nr:putative rho guanine nucleotide exchange factor 26 [Sesbania bispinosa]
MHCPITPTSSGGLPLASVSGGRGRGRRGVEMEPATRFRGSPESGNGGRRRLNFR